MYTIFFEYRGTQQIKKKTPIWFYKKINGVH